MFCTEMLMFPSKTTCLMGQISMLMVSKWALGFATSQLRFSIRVARAVFLSPLLLSPCFDKFDCPNQKRGQKPGGQGGLGHIAFPAVPSLLNKY